MLQQRGEYLHGDSDADIAEFLRLSWPYALRIQPVQLGGEKNLVCWFDIAAGAAAVQRRSDAIDSLHFLADSKARWNGAAANRMICSCGSDVHEVAVGLQQDDKLPGWVVIGTRCPQCGMLASPVDWNMVDT